MSIVTMAVYLCAGLHAYARWKYMRKLDQVIHMENNIRSLNIEDSYTYDKADKRIDAPKDVSFEGALSYPHGNAVRKRWIQIATVFVMAVLIPPSGLMALPSAPPLDVVSVIVGYNETLGTSKARVRVRRHCF
jgi:hypothetical protein